MASFTDLLGQRISNRMDSVTQPFSAPTDYLTNRVDQSMDYGNVQPRIGPTVAAAQGNQPGNPLNIPNPGVNPNQYVQDAQQLATEQPQPIAPDQVAALKQNEVAAAAPAPVAPAQDFNKFIAQQESGANPNVGYHYGTEPGRASSAYGTYGITAPAYKDIQQADPYFANRDITTLNKEEQARANLAYGNVLAGQLKQFGVEPTEQNIRGAHLAGARGLAEYLQKGTVSPAAAAANGGEAKFRQLLQSRLASVPTGDAAALPPEQSGNFLTKEVQKAHIENFQKNQNDLKVVSSTAFNEDVDPVTRMVANDKLVTALDNQKQVKEKSAIVDAALADPSGQGALKMMNQLAKESNDGSILKAIFYKRVGLNELASEEQKKLGAGDTYQPVMLEGGQQGWVKTNAQGAPLQGWTAQGPMTPQQLMSAQVGIKGTTTHTGKMIDRATGKVYYEQTTARGIRLVEAGTNQPFTGDSKTLSPYGIGSDLETQNKKQLQEFRNKLIYEPTIAAAKTYYEMASKVDPGDGSEIGKARQLFQRLNINPQEVGIQTQAPQQVQGAPQAVVPQTAAPVAQPTGAATATISVPAGELARRQGESFTAYEKRIRLLEKQQEVPIEVGKTEQTSFIKEKTDFANNAAPGAEVANIRRRQTNNLLNDPQIMGYLAGGNTASDNFSRVLREIITGAYDDKDGAKRLADEWQEAKLPPALLNKIQEYKQSNTRINALTLKSNEGPGAISNVEQRMNQNANMTNIGELGPWSALTGITQQQLTGDMTVAKQRFAEANPQLNTATAFQSAWSKEQDKIMKGYEGIYNARLAAIKPYYDSAQQAENKNNVAVQEAYRKATIAAFRTYPTPDYNPQTGKWEYRTAEAKRAALRAMMGNQ